MKNRKSSASIAALVAASVLSSGAAPAFAQEAANAPATEATGGPVAAAPPLSAPPSPENSPSAAEIVDPVRWDGSPRAAPAPAPAKSAGAVALPPPAAPSSPAAAGGYESKREALDLKVKEIVRRDLGSYFPGVAPSAEGGFGSLKLDPAAREKFEADIDAVIKRGGQKGAWDATKFKAWWDANKNAVLTPAQVKAWEKMPIEAILGSAYLRHAHEQSENNQTKFRGLLEHYVDNEWVLWGLDGTVGAVAGLGSFVGNSVWNAFTFVIIGDMVRAYSDSLTNTPKQVIGVVGTQHTKRLAAPLTEKGQAYVNYRLKKADEKRRAKEVRAAEKAKLAGLPSAGELAEATGKAAALNAEAADSAQRHVQLVATAKKLAALPAELDRMVDPRFFPTLSVEQLDQNRALFNKQFSETAVAWASTTLPTAQTGRSVMADGVIFRIKEFARDSAAFEQKMEIYRQAADKTKELLANAKLQERRNLEQTALEKLALAGATDDPGEVRRAKMTTVLAEKETGIARILQEEAAIAAKADELTKLVDTLTDLEFDGKVPDWQRTAALEADLEKLGMAPKQIAELKNSQRLSRVSRRQMVASFATQLLHDMMFPEFNKSMPDSLQKVLTTMRDQFGFAQFEKMYRQEIHKILHEAGIRIGEDVNASGLVLAQQTVAAAEASAELDALKLKMEAAPRPAKFSRLKDVASRMYLVRGARLAAESCQTAFSALGKLRPGS